MLSAAAPWRSLLGAELSTELHLENFTPKRASSANDGVTSAGSSSLTGALFFIYSPPRHCLDKI